MTDKTQVVVLRGGLEPPYTLRGPPAYKAGAITNLATGAFFGTPGGTRTRENATLKVWCLSHLTTGVYLSYQCKLCKVQN